MFLHVTNCEYLRDYVLLLRFNNGKEVEIDLADELSGEIFEPLQDPDYFKKWRLNPETETIEWPNGADFAPEFLLAKGKPLEASPS